MLTGRKLNQELASRYSRWLKVQLYSKITQRIYARAASDFCNFLGQTSATRCTPADVQEYLFNFSQTHPRPRALRSQYYSLRIFYDFMAMGNLIIWSPPRMLKLRTPPPFIPTVLTEAQIEKVMRAARNKQERALLEVLYGTGSRSGEIVSMKIEDIDFKAKRIRVIGKTGTRFVHFIRSTEQAIRKYIGHRKSGYLFVTNWPKQRLRPRLAECGGWRCRWKHYRPDGSHRILDKYLGGRSGLSFRQAVTYFSKFADPKLLQRPIGTRPLDSNSVTKIVKKIGVRVGFRVTPYILRHSFATHLLDHGADVFSLKELMGHRNLESTFVYTKVSQVRAKNTLTTCHPRSVSRHESQS